MAGRKPIHGQAGKGNRRTPLYRAWHNMKSRCYNPRVKSFRTYGEAGIRVCDQWLNFIPFMRWALSNGYREGLTIERKNCKGNYEPRNCCWVTKADQCANLSTNVFVSAWGERKTKSESARDPRCVVSLTTLAYRLKEGRNPEEAMTSRTWSNLKRSTPHGRHAVIRAFGEEKIVAQWAKDPRCGVSADTLHQRLQDGWNPERAISTPTQTKFRPVKV